MLVNSNELLKNALKDGYAIGAYNINNLEWAKYILEACNSDKSPVILAVSEKFLHEHNGQFNRSIILAPILEQGGFKTKRYVKKLEKQLDKELRVGKDKGLEQSMF